MDCSLKALKKLGTQKQTSPEVSTSTNPLLYFISEAANTARDENDNKIPIEDSARDVLGNEDTLTSTAKIDLYEPRYNDKDKTLQPKDLEKIELVGEVDKENAQENDVSLQADPADPTSNISGSFESCIHKYIRCIDSSVAIIAHEKCKSTFQACSLSVLSNSTLQTDETIEFSHSVVSDEKVTASQNKTIKKGTRLSKRLYKCIKEFSLCVKSQFGNCPRTYQRCTITVFDEDVQGRQSSSGSALNVDGQDESIETSTLKVTTSTQASTTSTATETSLDEDQTMQSYPSMLNPSGKYLFIRYGS